MCDLGRVLGQRFIMEAACGIWVQSKIELVFPAEFETCLGERVVATLRAWMAFGQVSSMCGYFIGDDARLDVILVR